MFTEAKGGRDSARGTISGNSALVETMMKMFQPREWVGISNGSLAEVVRSVRFTDDPNDLSPWRNGIYIRILQGTCHEISGDPSATIDRDCAGATLWVNSGFVSSEHATEIQAAASEAAYDPDTDSSTASDSAEPKATKPDAPVLTVPAAEPTAAAPPSETGAEEPAFVPRRYLL